MKAYWTTKDWQLTSATLAFKPIYGQHTGHTLGAIMRKVLTEFDLYDRVVAFTTDNASNNATMHSEVTRWIAQQLFCDGVENGEPEESGATTSAQPASAINASPEASGDETPPENGYTNPATLATPPELVPCLAHVVQLALKELMGQIRIQPSKTLMEEWDDVAATADINQLTNATKLKGNKSIESEVFLPLSLAKACVVVVDFVVDAC